MAKKPKKTAKKATAKAVKKQPATPKLLLAYNPPPQAVLDTLPVSEAKHRAWFLNLPEKDYQQCLILRANRELKIDIPDYDNYDDWLNYFKHLPAHLINKIAVTGERFLTVEAFAAVKRWADIIDNPQRIEKLHQSGLTNNSRKESLVDIAASNDRVKVLHALRDRIADQLEKGTGARDTASLARELGDILDQIHDAERRQGPAKNTKLGQLLKKSDTGKRTRGQGARNTSVSSRRVPQTIDDVEGVNG